MTAAEQPTTEPSADRDAIVEAVIRGQRRARTYSSQRIASLRGGASEQELTTWRETWPHRPEREFIDEELDRLDAEGLHPDDLRRRLPSITTPLGDGVAAVCVLDGMNDVEAYATAWNDGWMNAHAQQHADDPADADDWLAEHDERVIRQAQDRALRDVPAPLGRARRDALRARRVREQAGSHSLTSAEWSIIVLDDTLAAARALHRPDDPENPTYCAGCFEAGGYDGAPSWPCPSAVVLDGGAA